MITRINKASLSFILVIAVCIVFVFCSKDRIDAPDAIKKIIASSSNCNCQPFADEYKWRDRIVYLFSCRGPACYCITHYYDENGNRITMPTGYTPSDFQQEATRIRNVWACD